MNNRSLLSGYNVFRFLFVLAVLQTFMVETIQRQGLTDALLWLGANIHIFLLNSILAFLLNLFFLFLAGSLQLTVIISSLSLIVLSFASVAKKQFLGDPLFPWDFLRLDQVWNLLPQYSQEIPIILVVLGLFTLGLIVIGKLWLPKYHAGWSFRIVLLLFICVVTPLLIFYRHTPLESALKKMDIQTISWAQDQHTLSNGFLLGFAMNMENLMIFEPEGYDASSIERIIEENTASFPAMNLEDNNKSINISNSKHKPNVIVVLNESFWDPTILTDLTFSKDPIPYFRKLSNENPSGTMVSPVFGGSTANVEFEILTGLSTKFLPQGAIAYQLYIEDSLPALPGWFRASGYTTTAIHPYHSWFYKRDSVLPLLGFEKFYSIQDFPEAKIKGEYIGDLDVSQRIIRELKDSVKPSFIFAITMQNHGPYPKDRYAKNEITVSGKLSAQGQGILETYTQGLYDADQALKNLIEEIEELDEPTSVVFLGDHLPYLGKDYLVYQESGYLNAAENKWSAADHLKMKSVPFVIWSNYQVKVPMQEEISAPLLGNTLLDIAGLQDSFVTNFCRDFAKQLPVYGKTVNIDYSGQSFLKLPDNFASLEEDYRLLQYDILFGERYYKNLIRETSSSLSP